MEFVYLHQNSFLRLLIPLIAGFFCGDYFYFEKWNGAWMPVLFFVFVGILFTTYFLKRYSLRWLFGVSLFCVCFIGGFWWMSLHLEQTSYHFPEKESTYRVKIYEKPEMKARTVLCPVKILEVRDPYSISNVGKSALLYIALDSLSIHLRVGDELLVSALIKQPANNGNFDEFDYARFLTRKGISGTGYVATENWKKIGNRPINSLRDIATEYRDSLLALYHHLGFKSDEFAVLSALTVGEKEELSEDIRESYSISGASHVLALSGLHIGLLAALLLFCMRLFPEQWKITKWLRALFILGILWAFAFFTGLSASVIRSVVMFSVCTIAVLFNRNSLSLNTLAITAFFMLLICPVWLFDVGFQLSFAAVAAILLLQPSIYRIFTPKRKLPKYIWGLMSVSVAAQIGTAPLVLLYFSRFSTHFLLTNLLVIPLVLIIMYSAVLMLLFTPVPLIQGWVASGLKELLSFQNESVKWIEQLPFSSIDNIWVDKIEVCLFYLSIFLFLRYQMYRTGKTLFIFLSGIFLLCSYHVAIFIYDQPKQSLIFYNFKDCPAVHCISSDRRSWLSYVGNPTFVSEKSFRRSVSNYWKHHHLQQPIIVNTDYKDNDFSRYKNILSFKNCRVCIVNDNHWRNKSSTCPLSINYIYLCKGYNGTIEELTFLFKISHIILDSSISEYKKRAFSEECKHLGLSYLSLSEKGSVTFLL